MSEAITIALYDTLRQYGVNLLTTPRMFETLFTQRFRPPAGELVAVMAAVEFGAADHLLDNPKADLTELSNSLAKQANLPAHTARWSMELWSVVLTHVVTGKPPSKSQWAELAKPPTAGEPGDFRKGLFGAILVGLIGFIAGGLPGLLISAGVERETPRAVKIRNLIEKKEPPGVRMAPREFAKWTGLLGGLGGLIGAALGWMAGGFKRATNLRIAAACIGAFWAFDGAVFGAVHYGLAGVLFGSMLTGGVMSVVATMLGPYAFALIGKQAAWFLLDHF